MRNDDHCLFADAELAVVEASERPEREPSSQSSWGVAGRLRPYGDVRASFETWRRLALKEWAAREDAVTVH